MSEWCRAVVDKGTIKIESQIQIYPEIIGPVPYFDQFKVNIYQSLKTCKARNQKVSTSRVACSHNILGEEIGYLRVGFLSVHRR